MSTNQPIWKYLANLGDATPLDYGGAFLLQDETGVYPPELWIYDADTRERSTVLLEPVKPCPDLPGDYGDNRFHPNHPAWWSKGLESIAATSGMAKDELAELLCSDEPQERAEGYLAIVAHHGVFEFDQYPYKYTRKEARAWMESINPDLV